LLPKQTGNGLGEFLFVSDESLDTYRNRNSTMLYKNMTCLLITRQLVQHLLRVHGKKTRRGVDVALSVFYVLLFCIGLLTVPFKSMDRFLWHQGRFADLLPTPYEFLIFSLFFPLILIAISGCVRMLLVWKGLRDGILVRLEGSPLRQAFQPLDEVKWTTMLRRGGLQEYWMDMSRMTESLRQILNQTTLMEYLQAKFPEFAEQLSRAQINLERHIKKLATETKSEDQEQSDSKESPEKKRVDIHADVPRPEDRGAMDLVWDIESNYAAASEALLQGVLLPYWLEKRTGLVQAKEEKPKDSAASPLPVPLNAMVIGHHDGCIPKRKHFEAKFTIEDPRRASREVDLKPFLPVVEEFLALRYLSMIRSILVNMKHMISFVSVAFVLAMVAWNSYPFQPRREVNWMFTTLLLFFGTGVVYVFAQMHRNPLLNRIANTEDSTLGGDFYKRVLGFGAVPLLTWLAYQFPEIGGSLFRTLQPVLTKLQ
jgi:hypothetical protein